MLIKSKEEFDKHLSLIHTTTLTLVKQGSDIQNNPGQESILESWTKKIEMLEDNPLLPLGFTTLSYSVLAAYYIASKMIEFSPDPDKNNLYPFFEKLQSILEFLDEYPIDKTKMLAGKQALLAFILSNALNFSQMNVEIMINTALPVLTMQDIYVHIKGWVRSAESWETPDREKGWPEINLCDRVPGKAIVRMREMAILLEEIIKQKKQSHGSLENWLNNSFSVGDLQNELGHTGLFFGEKLHSSFCWGPKLLLPELLNYFNKLDFLAWSLTDKIAKCMQYKFYGSAEGEITEDEKERYVESILKVKAEVYEILQAHQNNLLDPHLYKKWVNYLRSIENAFGFTKKQLLQWLTELRELTKLYETCVNHHLQNDQPLEDTAPPVVVLLFGDSMALSLRTLHKDRHRRWVPRSESILNAAGIPLRIINASRSGKTTEDLEIRKNRAEGTREDEGGNQPDPFELCLQYFKPDMVFCTLGGNDAASRYNLFGTLDRMEALVDKCRSVGIAPEQVIWGTGMPKTIKVKGKKPAFSPCDGFRNTFNGMVEKFVRTGAKGVLLSKDILETPHIDEDQMHFLIDIQEDIANEAAQHIMPIAQLLSLEKQILERKMGEDSVEKLLLLEKFKEELEGLKKELRELRQMGLGVEAEQLWQEKLTKALERIKLQMETDCAPTIRLLKPMGLQGPDLQMSPTFTPGYSSDPGATSPRTATPKSAQPSGRSSPSSGSLWG